MSKTRKVTGSQRVEPITRRVSLSQDTDQTVTSGTDESFIFIFSRRNKSEKGHPIIYY